MKQRDRREPTSPLNLAALAVEKAGPTIRAVITGQPEPRVERNWPLDALVIQNVTVAWAFEGNQCIAKSIDAGTDDAIADQLQDVFPTLRTAVSSWRTVNTDGPEEFVMTLGTLCHLARNHPAHPGTAIVLSGERSRFNIALARRALERWIADDCANTQNLDRE